MSKPRPALPPEVLDFERVKHIVAGSLQSRSDPERTYAARFILDANAFCACPDSSIRRHMCVHLRELLKNMDAEELREWVIDSTTVEAEAAK